MNIALYPGAFKPPTKGHLGVVQQVLSGKYDTAKIDRETGKYEKIADNPPMDEVWIIVGDMVKGGPEKQKGSEPEVAVGQYEAIKIWEEYLETAGLTSRVKLYKAGEVREEVLNEDVGYICEGANPVRDTYGLLKDKYIKGGYEGINFFPIVGFRPDNAEALTDLKRMDAASKKYGEQGLQILVVLDEPTPGEESVSATKLRAALAAKDKSKIEKYAAASADALLKIFSKQDELDQAIAEAMTKAIEDMLSSKMPPIKEEIEEPKEEVEESTRDMPSPEIEDIATPPSEFKNKLEYHKQYFQNLTSYPVTVDKYGNIVIQIGQRLPMNEVTNINEITSQELDFTPFLSSILEFMLDKGMTITPIPNIEIKMDVDAATDVFGPTAHYDPSSATVCLYVLGRHPKDVLRSFCHEMIHHMQNMEGRLPAFGTTNTQEDSVLNEIEKEAHALGSMTFREWEDTVKNNFDVVKEEVMNEKRGKMNPFAKKITTIVFDLFKGAYESGQEIFDRTFYVGPEEEMDIQADLDFHLRLYMDRGPYNYTGGADSGEPTPEDYEREEDPDDNQPYIEVVVTLPDNFNNWSEFYMDLLDVIRHELEHLRQGGPNVRRGGHKENDDHIRAAIKAGLVPEKEYYKLDKEVDAMIQGLWAHAKKAKKPLISVMNRYLDAQGVEGGDREEVLDAWRKRLPALGVSKDQRF